MENESAAQNNELRQEFANLAAELKTFRTQVGTIEAREMGSAIQCGVVAHDAASNGRLTELTNEVAMLSQTVKGITTTLESMKLLHAGAVNTMALQIPANMDPELFNLISNAADAPEEFHPVAPPVPAAPASFHLVGDFSGVMHPAHTLNASVQPSANSSYHQVPNIFPHAQSSSSFAQDFGHDQSNAFHDQQHVSY